MKLVNYKSLMEAEAQGNLLFAYGDSGVGKTSTILQTAEDPITYLSAEGRKIQTTIAAISRPDLKMRVGIYEGFNDLIETCVDVDRFEGSKTIVLDSFTHLMVVHLAQEVLAENYDKLSEKDQKEVEKALTQQVKLSQEAYGTLSGQMNRLMRALQRLTVAGYDVVCTARTEDRPKWNRALACAPALMGKEFSKSMDGYFDFICILQSDEKEGDPPGVGADIKKVWKYHAPLASFNACESYLAKWTGIYPSKGIVNRKFHVKRVFEEANGK